MTDFEKSFRVAADKADAWADKAEKSGRLEDAATLRTLAAAAQDKAGRLARDEAAKPPSCSGHPDASTACSLCGAPGIRGHNGLTLSCTNPACVRFMCDVAANVF